LSVRDAISPVDGRYRKEVEELASYFSEKALFKERIEIEIEYLKAIIKRNAFKDYLKLNRVPAKLNKVLEGERWYEEIKEIERRVGHDVKAVEIWLKGRLESLGLGELAPFVHLGLTSEDINGIAQGRILLRAVREVMIRAYVALLRKLGELAKRYSDRAFLARTHGIPAIPTTFGKELGVFAFRLANELEELAKRKPYGKLSGAVGCFNALRFLNPEFDWLEFSKEFVKSMGLIPTLLSKQTVPHEKTSEIFHYIITINNIMQELARDLWYYQALGLIRFKKVRVGSSTMPHKVNPVDLENAEGQIDASNYLLFLLAYRLQQTRMQRDLSDSTLKRLYGQALAHSLIACKRIYKALDLMIVNEKAMDNELSKHQECLSEAVQVSLRVLGDVKGYEKVFEKIGELEEIKERVGGEIGKRLRKLRLNEYVGFAKELALLASRRAEEVVKRLSSIR